MDECAEELHRVLGHENLSGVPLLVLANKQDLPDAFSADEVRDRLQLDKATGRNWFVQSAVATKGIGLCEGLDWLSKNFKPKKKKE